MLREYEIHDGKLIAVIFRTKETGQTEPCPFCGLSHKHGIGDGHRVAHCVSYHHKGKLVLPKDTFITKNGRIIFRDNGYIVRTVANIENSIFLK